MDNRKIILAVAYDDVSNQYTVDIASGASVSEAAFAMSIVIKCLLRDDVIEDASVVTDLIDEYLTDVQYEEVIDAQTMEVAECSDS